jgi:hypothetical protein
MNVNNEVLATWGIGSFENVYSLEELNAINTAINPLFASRNQVNRSYVHIDEMMELNVLDAIFSHKMKTLLFSIVCDPVLYHCHVNEIACNSTRSHIFGDHLSGWHRDADSEYFPTDATHVSIFVYFTPVGEGDGAFELIPQCPLHWLWKRTPCISVTGNPGLTFAWNRAFYHRASPNRGPRRRRLLKISIQPNRFTSPTLANEAFQKVISSTPLGDSDMDVLLGRYQGTVAPKRTPPDHEPTINVFKPTGELGIGNGSLMKVQLRKQARALKRWLMRTPAGVTQYD